MSIISNQFYLDDYTGDRLESSFMPESWIEVDPDGQMFIHLAPSDDHPDGMWDPVSGKLLYKTLGALGLFTLGRVDQDGNYRHFGDNNVPSPVTTTTTTTTTAPPVIPPPVNDPLVALYNWHSYALSILGGPGYGPGGVTPPVWTAPTPPDDYSGKYKEIYDFIAAW